MAFWITHKLPISEWGSAHYKLEVAQRSLRSSLHLAMLVKQSISDKDDDVFIVLPDDQLLALFPGFVRISEHDLPPGLKLLLGDRTIFVKCFPEVAHKLQATAATDIVRNSP